MSFQEMFFDALHPDGDPASDQIRGDHAIRRGDDPRARRDHLGPEIWALITHGARPTRGARLEPGFNGEVIEAQNAPPESVSSAR